MKKLRILLSILGPFALIAQDSHTTPTLEGVLLVDDSLKMGDRALEKIKSVQLDGVKAEEEAALKKDLAPYLADLALTEDGVKSLCDAVAAYYHENQDLRVAVSAPEQNTSKGVVKLLVAPERVGEVRIKDNQYTKPETLKKLVRLASADPINEKTVAQDLGWMNTNPFRTVKVDYQPGEKPGVTNVEFVVSDKKNWKITSGVDNTGTQPVGPVRIFAGVNVNDFLFTDHTLKLQAMTADHYSEFQSYTGEYVALLPWRNTLKIFGSYSGTVPTRAPFPQKHRESFQASGRYGIPQWFGVNPWVDQISYEAGYDFKGSNTNIFFEGEPAPTKNILAFVSQFTASVGVQRNRNDTKLSAGVDLVGSPLRMLPHQTDADYANLREGATAQYLYSRASLSVDQKIFGGWKVFAQGRSQFSFSDLLPSEQFSLGGYSTVRGYQERIVNGDNAVCGNLEIKTPEMTVAGIWYPKVKDSLTFLGFVDGGYAWYRNAVDATPVSQSLLGVGPGVRYNVSSYFTSRFDVGFPLLEVAKDNMNPHLHFNAILSY